MMQKQKKKKENYFGKKKRRRASDDLMVYFISRDGREDQRELERGGLIGNGTRAEGK
jgi:hypothetical protein